MTVKFIENTYQNKTGILMFPDHYLAFPQTFVKEVDGSEVYSITENGRQIIKAGTIYPANDATAKGVVLYDLDVTDGDETGAIVYHGTIKTDKLPAAPVAAAISALPQITFFPIKKTLINTATPDPVIDDTGAEIIIDLYGTDFLAAAETEANWTVDVGTSGLTFTTATKISANQVKLTFTGTVAAGTVAITADKESVANDLASNTLSIVIA